MKKPSEIDQKIKELERQLSYLDNQREEILDRLTRLKNEKSNAQEIQPNLLPTPYSVTQESPAEQKVSLFRSIFRGREDVYPRRWENIKSKKSGYSPACKNEWIPGICNKPKIKCGECENRSFLPITDEVIRNHLLGYDLDGDSSTQKRDFTIGIYPLLIDETCYFLAADFDKDEWMRDASAFLETCEIYGVPAYLERSRSGNGGHIWIFFSSPIPAVDARKLGSFLLTETMNKRPEISFESYDRFFPNQDTLPSGGFGNLIALPLQGKPRQKGNSVFLKKDLTPYEDQWKFLASIRKISGDEIKNIVEDAKLQNRILGVRMALDDEEQPWTLPPSRRRDHKFIEGALPNKATIILGNQLYIEKKDLPPSLINMLLRLAAFQNPEFYKAQAMRFPTFGKPRIIACAEMYSKHIGLPRGCLEETIDLFKSLNIDAIIQDERNRGKPLYAQFLGKLTDEQQKALEALLPHDTGILSAATAFGKTVVAAKMIAERGCNTLILVHRRQLLDQWISQIGAFLDLEPSKIGQIGAGKRKPSGIIDIALIQSLIKKREVDNLTADYGQVIVDECHHLSAVSFEAVARQCKAQYVLGLSATITRKDGHHPIIFMQCGPIRFRVNPKDQAKKRPFHHQVILRKTPFNMAPTKESLKSTTIHEIYNSLITDNSRNEMIVRDVLNALKKGRSPLVITERKAHLEQLSDRLSKLVKNTIVLHGGIGSRKRKELMNQLIEIPEEEERLLIATGRYLGEGFDDPRLDALFLTMPISWKGTLAQYAGRLHRIHHSKKDVVIYDYVDENIPMLMRMSERRMRGYRGLGYEIMAADSDFLE